MSIFDDVFNNFRQPIQTQLDTNTTSVAAAHSSTETLSGYFNTPRLVPSWMGSQSDDVAFDVDKIDGTTPPTLGQVDLIPVRVVQDRVYDAIKFGVAATTMTNCYVGLYAADLTTGDLTKVLDLGDCKSQLNTGFAQQTVAITVPIGVQRGELYYLAVLQVGGTAAAMHRNSSTTTFTTGLYPRYRGNTYATGSQTALPSSIAVADVLSGTRFWGALGTAAAPVAPASILLSDSFNRADASSLGSNWTMRSGTTIGIFGNRPRLISSAVRGLATHNTRLSSVAQRVGFTHYSDTITDHWVSLRGNGLGPSVSLYILASSSPSYQARIITSTSYATSTATLRATYTAPDPAGLVGNWTFEAVGTTYTAYQNGVLRAQWVDSGGAFTVGSNSTEVGFVVSDTPLDGTPTFDDWFAQDI